MTRDKRETPPSSSRYGFWRDQGGRNSGCVGRYDNTRTAALALGLAAAASILASGVTVTSMGVAACSDHVRNRRRSADCRTGDRSAARAEKSNRDVTHDA